MVMPKVEQEPKQSLENILDDSSPDDGDVSEQEDTEEPTSETPQEETEETPDVFESRVQSELDKRTNSYRKKREADTAFIRSLSSEVKDLRKQVSNKEMGNRINRLLEGYEDEGHPLEEKPTFAEDLKAVNQKIKEYNEKSAEVEEAAQLIGEMTKNLPEDIVKEFGLDDANPNIRAANGARFLDGTIAGCKHTQDFLMALENFLPKGDEVRKQIEDIVDGMAEFTNEKSKKLYLRDQLKGIKVTPRKKPPSPSDGLGGWNPDEHTIRENIAYGLKTGK